MSLRNDLAQHIRRVDGANQLAAHDLGHEIAARIIHLICDINLLGIDIVAFVERVNPDKRMGAGALADAIVDHFNLEG